MPQRQYRTLSKRTVDALSVNGKDAIFWDRDLPGFGVRVYPSGKKVFVVQTRAFGRSKRVTLGEHGAPNFSVADARKKAAEVIGRIKTGQPPVPPEPAPDPTVADLAERYQREYVAMRCKPLTISHYRIMLRKHIVPALGERLVADVEYKDILAFHNSLAAASGPMADQVPVNVNYAWKAVRASSFLAGDTRLAEFAMSVSGTVIVTAPVSDGDEAGPRVRILEPLALDRRVTEILMEGGGDLPVYRCDTNDACLNPTLGRVAVPADRGFRGRVANGCRVAPSTRSSSRLPEVR